MLVGDDRQVGLEPVHTASAEETQAVDLDLAADSDFARVLALLLQVSPSFSLRGGTREILRGIIARGLGLR